MNIIKRLSGIANAQMEHGVDTLEDPAIMTEEGIRILQGKLEHATNAEVDIKGKINTMRANEKSKRDKAAELKSKAMEVLKRVGPSLTQEAADSAAKGALDEMKSLLLEADSFKVQGDNLDGSWKNLHKQIGDLSSMITEAQNHLSTLSAREETAKTAMSVNEELSSLHLDNTKAMFDRMEQKVTEHESKAQAYLDIEQKSSTQTIDDLLKTTNTSAADDLAALKLEMSK